MNYVRWYDKDPDLSHLMHFIEGLNDEVRNEIAQDLIQIMTSELSINADGQISDISSSGVTEYKRWYDRNITLHSAVEMIKNLDTEERREIIERIMESIVQILTELNYETQQ